MISIDNLSPLPGLPLLGLHLLFFGLFLIRGRIPQRRNITILTVALLCGLSPVTGLPILLIFFSPLVGKAIAVPLYRAAPDPAIPSEGYDLIVVPTAGVRRNAEGGWRPSEESILRFDLGRELQRRFDTPLLLIGGALEPDMPSEAEVIAAAAGVVEPRLLLDSEPVNSWETSRRVAQLLENREYPRVILVTSAYHMLRMAASLRSAGLIVFGVTTDLRGHRRAVRLSDVIPSMHGLNLVRTATHEYLMTVWYSLQGRLRLADLTAA
jgi:uncharacterized SAM-binding protein YcdF (DUF218 family)